MNTELIQQEVNKVILKIKTLPSFGRLNKATQKAQNELRELGLEQYVPAWMMEKGAKADRIINGLIEAAKEDGTRTNYSNRKDSEGENTTAIGETYPQSTLYGLLNPVETEEEVEIADELATREDVEEAVATVFGTEWNPTGSNITSIWKDADASYDPMRRNYWYANNQSAYETYRIRIGRTKTQVTEWVAERLADIAEMDARFANYQ